MRRTIAIAQVLIPFACAAQLFTSNGAAVTVQAGAQLTVKGAVGATAGASIANAGTISLSGDLINNSGSGLFTAVPGTVIMNGAAQNISGASSTTFDDLDLLCTTLTLQQDALVGGTYAIPSGVLALNDAILQLNTYRLKVANAATGAITRNNGHMMSETDPIAGYGEVQWDIGNSAGTYIVPFGTGTTYLPVTLDITAAGTGPGMFVFSTYPTDPFANPNNRPLPTGLTVLTDMGGGENAPNVLDRFWPIAEAGYTTAPTAELTFTYRDQEWITGTNTISENTLQAQQFNGTAWSYPPTGTVNTTTNTVTTAPTNSFGVVWALTQSFAPLPIELVSFDARPEGEVVQCAWITATEIDNDFFTVERSVDGSVFADIGEVNGAGNSLNTNEYIFDDDAPLPGLSYYRLRQTDFDGTETWSAAVPVWRDTPGAELALYPNPCKEILFIVGLAETPMPVHIIDGTGRVVMDVPSLRGMVDVSSLPPGGYAVLVQQVGGQRALRFVKE